MSQKCPSDPTKTLVARGNSLMLLVPATGVEPATY